MEAATLEDYQALIEERPRKFSPAEVGYVRSDKPSERCFRCLHFFVRSIDGFTVCEIMRNKETDEKGVDPDFVCKFFTRDAEHFPRLEESEG